MTYNRVLGGILGACGTWTNKKSDRFAPIGTRLALYYSNFLRSTTWCIRPPNLSREVPHPGKVGSTGRYCPHVSGCGTSRERLGGLIHQVVPLNYFLPPSFFHLSFASHTFPHSLLSSSLPLLSPSLCLIPFVSFFSGYLHQPHFPPPPPPPPPSPLRT